MSTFFVVITIASILYPMRNICGGLTRLSIFGMIAYVIFSDFAKGLDDKIIYVGILSIPIVINIVFRFLKLKILKT